MNERQKQAQRIIEAPHEYAVCIPCGSIVTRRSCLCPACNGYLFDRDNAAIVARAQELATREASSVAPGDLQ